MTKNQLPVEITENQDNLQNDEGGLSTVEYIVILILIVVLCITVWTNFGKTVESHIDNANTQISSLMH